MPQIERDFSKLVAQVDYTLYIVTAAHEGEFGGCLIGFASQVSIHPPRFLAGLSRKNRTFRIAERASSLIVHPVPTEAAELAELFGGQTGDEIDKFARCRWTRGPDGAPVLDELGSWFAGRILERHDFGDHVGLLLEPTEVHVDEVAPTLTFRRGKYIDPGHAP